MLAGGDATAFPSDGRMLVFGVTEASEVHADCLDEHLLLVRLMVSSGVPFHEVRTLMVSRAATLR